MLKGFTRQYRPLEILSPEEMENIHRGALYILEKTGMRVEHDRALSLFADNDCQVDFQDRLVRIPSSLVEESLRKCPSNYVLKARDPELDLVIGGNTVYFMQGMGMRYVDLETWETRPASAEEHREAMVVADALDHLHLADGVFFYMEREHVPPVLVMLENLLSGLRYSAKAEQFGYQKDCSIFAIKMAQTLGVNLNPELDTASPLTLYGGAVEAAFRYLEAGFPIQPTVSTTMGAEAPVTHASSMVLSLAMIMSWAVLAQLIRPGAPISIQHGMKPMDMRTGMQRFGAVSRAITTIMTHQFLRRYQIPSCPGLGFASDSKKIDYQAGYEKGMGALISALSGANLIIFHGGSCGELLYHPALSILDDDIAGWIGRLIEGATVTDETMAIDLINSVGPIPGHYLSAAHTREWWRKEQFIPSVADLEPYPSWLQSGKRDALDHAKERMQQILREHSPKAIPSDQDQSLENIMNEAREFFRKKEGISDQEWDAYQKEMGFHHSA
jgi:trimethylamine--corrinoid protein Co-methyltransferase